MISELNDQEILEFLMNSDFEGDYSPEELKYLLVKWRYFFRIINGRLEREKDEKESEIRKNKDNEEKNNFNIQNLQLELARKQDKIDFIGRERKLTWKERISGKIINGYNGEKM